VWVLQYLADGRATDELPRVLIVAAGHLNAFSGTAITMRNLFSAWPHDKLAQIFTMADQTHQANPCLRSFLLHPRYAPADYYARRLLARTRSVVLNTRVGRDEGMPASIHFSSGGLHAHLRAIADLSPVRVPTTLRRWIHAFRPDLVYSPLGSVRIMRIASRVSRECRRPLMPHFMDDWPATLYADGELLGLAESAVARELRRLITNSRHGICISQPMAAEYEQRYGIPFTAFANCVDDSAFGDPTANMIADPVDLIYVGGLHLGRWQALQRIGSALKLLRGDGIRARLTIHAPEHDLATYASAFAGQPLVTIGNPLSPTVVPGVLRSADILVYVESFDEAVGRYTHLSTSTKVPQYLAAARPILAYGPATLASIAHLKSTGAAVVVAVDSPAAVAAALVRLSRDPELRDGLGRRGHAFAYAHHRRTTVAAQFATLMVTATRTPSRSRAL
jgi:glycosyltransferase involved in cell wall biosynthesis